MGLRQRLLAGIVAAGFMAVATAADAQIYSWRDGNGRLVLSDRPPVDGTETMAVSGSSNVRTTRPLARMTRAGTYDAVIDRYAAREGVRPDLVRAVIQVESGFNPNARSHVGAMGLMQLMPDTAAELGVVNAYDPEQNIRGGVHYLRQLLTTYDGNEELALAAYNAGPGTVERYGNQVPPYPETQDYVERVRASTALDGETRTPAPSSGTTIFKVYKTVRGRRIAVYTNVMPPSGEYEIASRPRR